MIDVSQLPAVRAQLERDAAAAQGQTLLQNPPAPTEYARAPVGAGHTPARPAATQRTTR